MDLISWSKEASYRLPVRILQELMDFYYRNTAWRRIHREVFDDMHHTNGKTGSRAGTRRYAPC